MFDKRIDPYSFIPKYLQLFSILRTKIENQEWEPNQLIPSERELENTYNISRTTVRQGLARLQNFGFIYRELGKGTFVAPPKLQNSLHVLTSFSNDMRDRGLIPSQKILNMSYIDPPANIRQHLELTSDVNRVLYMERLRLANDIPIGIHYTYLPLSQDQTISLEEIKEYGSLYKLLETKFNLIPTEADETLESTIAGINEAGLLGLKQGSPLLLIERTVWSQNRKAMEFVKVLYRGDRYKYYVRLTGREAS